MGDFEIDGVDVIETSVTDIDITTGDKTPEDHGMDTVDGLFCSSHCKPCGNDEPDTRYMSPSELRSALDEVPLRSELRVKHGQQDKMEGDPLGGTLVTYKIDQGEYIHHFEEFGLHEKSLLRDSLHVSQNDQLVTLNELTVNEMDHNAVVKQFLGLELGQEHVMVVANHHISTDTFRQISFSIYGVITEKHEDEEKPEEMVRIDNYTLAFMPFTNKIDEVNISPAGNKHVYLNKDLRFVSTRSIDTDASVHFTRKRSPKMVGPSVQISSTLKHKEAGYLAIDEQGNVVWLPQFHPKAAFKASYNDWGSWRIRSEYNGRFLAEENGRLCSIPNDQDGQFDINPSKCRSCV